MGRALAGDAGGAGHRARRIRRGRPLLPCRLPALPRRRPPDRPGASRPPPASSPPAACTPAICDVGRRPRRSMRGEGRRAAAAPSRRRSPRGNHAPTVGRALFWSRQRVVGRAPRRRSSADKRRDVCDVERQQRRPGERRSGRVEAGRVVCWGRQHVVGSLARLRRRRPSRVRYSRRCGGGLQRRGGGEGSSRQQGRRGAAAAHGGFSRAGASRWRAGGGCCTVALTDRHAWMRPCRRPVTGRGKGVWPWVTQHGAAGEGGNLSTEFSRAG